MQETSSPSTAAAADQSCPCHESLWRWRRRRINPSFLISVMYTLIIAVASSSASSDVSSNVNVRDSGKSPTRELQKVKDLHNTGPDGRCNNLIRTKPIRQVYLGQGIFFAIKSDDNDDDGVMITSLGFHLDLPKSRKKVSYEAWVLKEEVIGMGYFASPERQTGITGAVNVTAAEQLGQVWYDYRVDSDVTKNWKRIAEGTLVSANLTLESTTEEVMEEDFYQIPLGTFRELVPPNGGIRSFFIATMEQAFVYSDSTQMVNDELSTSGTTAPGDYAPKLLVGEGIISYPTLPDSGFSYLTRSFVGKVFYEKMCPSSAPSLSTSPSFTPTVAFSDGPSLVPSLTLAPSGAPSAIPSALPSSMPTQQPTDYVENINVGVGVKIAGIACTPGEPIAEGPAVGKSVKALAKKAATEGDPYIVNVDATVMGMFCSLANPFQRHGRRLPSGSSSLDFSVVVTGEYRPPSRPGQKPPQLTLDLGKATEDSINRDPVGFVKDIKARAGEASVLADVEPEDVQLEIQAFVVPEDPTVLASVKITPNPTRSPTQRPTPLAIMEAQKEARGQPDEEKGNDSILIIMIVITGGLIVLLGAFLLFRHGERKAAKTRRMKLERQELEKERMREERRQQAQWDQVNKSHQVGKGDMGMGGPAPQYGNPNLAPAYGQPPPNYYPGGPPLSQGPPPQGFNYNYPPPPPPFGQSYAGPPNQGYPYPPVPPGPGASYPPTGASYDQKHQRVSWEPRFNMSKPTRSTGNQR